MSELDYNYGNIIWTDCSDAKGNRKARGRVLTCDACDKCELYKRGLCILRYMWNATGFCKYGNLQEIYGPTTRAKSYFSFLKTFRNHPKYLVKLDSPFNKRYIFKIGDEYRIWLSKQISFDKNDILSIQTNDRAQNYIDTLYLKKEEITPEFLKALVDIKDHGIWFGANEYKTTILPEFMFQLMRLLPEVYGLFCLKYPDYIVEFPKDIHVGKWAFVNTLTPGCKVVNNNKSFMFDGKYLINNNYRDVFLFDGEVSAELKIEVHDRLKCKITDDSQVNENTVFC